MPKCLYFKKVFINQQALGNHVKKHLDNSDEDLSFLNKVIHTNLVEITNRILIDQNKLERQNLSVKKDINYKQHCFKYNLDNSLKEINSNVIELFDQSDSQSNNHSDSQSNISDIQLDLLDITDVDFNEYTKYDDLYSGKSKGPEDIYQEFSSEEYAEFMHLIT
ncbi:12994_t:CDS:2 [Cetraspora pellucida]|uniref:12994_t:CDS:1 n=1 Tax=Cetraspora pellucida TaxID=1433469 RepID=A0A9N9JYM7_9GLOM|nr:12994_t:CDS:2 [Cetraspora pellucida]